MKLKINRFSIFDFPENYRLQSKYENHLIAKVALFQFVNSFLSLFYIAFYLRDQEKLKEQLAGLLISRQIIGNLRESAFPYLMEQLKLANLSFRMWGALSPTQECAQPLPSVTEAKVSVIYRVSSIPLLAYMTYTIFYKYLYRRKTKNGKSSKNHRARQSGTLDRPKSKALCTNMMVHFPIIWRC